MWGFQSEIEDDVSGDEEITMFGCTMVILCSNDIKIPPPLKLSPNLMIENLSLRVGIQDYTRIVILG